MLLCLSPGSTRLAASGREPTDPAPIPAPRCSQSQRCPAGGVQPSPTTDEQAFVLRNTVQVKAAPAIAIEPQPPSMSQQPPQNQFLEVSAHLQDALSGAV